MLIVNIKTLYVNFTREIKLFFNCFLFFSYSLPASHYKYQFTKIVDLSTLLTN